MKNILCSFVLFFELLNATINAQSKTISPNKASFDLGAGSFNLKYFMGKKNYQNDMPESSCSNDKAIITKSYELPKMMRRVLHKQNLLDTAKNVFPNSKTNLKLDLSVERFDINFITVQDITHRFIYSEYITWQEAIIDYRILLTLKSHFGKVLQTETLSSSIFLNQYSYNANNLDKIFEKFEESIASNIQTFVTSEDVKPLIELDHGEDQYFELNSDTVYLKSQSVQEIPDWNQSLVTVLDSLGHGSGCVVSSDGYIVTNYHVIAQSNNLKVKLHNNRSFPGTVVRYDPETDLALLKVDTINLHTFDIRKSYDDLIGESIFIGGTPVDTLLTNSITSGIVGGIRQYHGVNYLQTDAVINFGNSGGPMLTPDGKIAGIVNAKIGGFGVEGIGFAIPCDYLFTRLKLKRLSAASPPSP